MKIRTLSLLLILSVIMSCDTDDILPALTLTTSSNEISENQEQITITASLNSDANEDIILPLSFSGTATFDFDYVTTESALIISSGNSSGSISISSMQDNEIEDIETIIISVESQNDVLVTSSSITISILDDDSDSDGDGINDSDDDCPNEAGLPEYNGCSQPLLIINEVLYDPPSGDAGDANGDGTREAQEDEFIEFVNIGGTLDLSGYTIHDNAQERHIFPEGTVPDLEVELAPFKHGAFTMAIEHQIPIVPMTFLDNKKRFPWSFGGLLGGSKGSPGKLRVKIHDPIETKGMSKDNRVKLSQDVRELMLKDLRDS